MRPARAAALPVADAGSTASSAKGTRLPFDPVAEARRQWQLHGWADAAGGMAAVTSLMRAQQIALARVEAVLRPFAVTFSRYEVLMLLSFSSRGELPMSVIGARLQVHPTSVTNAVDRLQGAGLVSRTAHPTDRRATVVQISEDGRQLALSATEALNSQVFPHTGLNAAQVDALFQLLAVLRKASGDF